MARRVTLADFPGAPANGYVSREGWLVCGDQAWTRDEWAATAWHRARDREYRRRPEVRARRIAASKRWAAEHREERKAYNREWMRRKRGNMPLPVGSLHDLACSGPTRATGCVCRKIKVYDKPVERAA